MADMNMPQKKGKRKVQAPRVDLTPMVDLGFLLITFFIFTTTMAEAKTMEVNMPYRPPTETSVVPEPATIVIIPIDGHRLAYYEGLFDTKKPVKLTQFEGRSNVREVLMNKQKEVRQLPLTFSKEAHKLHVIIKPHDNCTYEDVVSLLDEMNILQVPYYTIDDVTTDEGEWLRKISL